MPEKGQWMSYVGVLPPGAALRTTRRSTFATVSPNSHTAHRHVCPPKLCPLEGPVSCRVTIVNSDWCMVRDIIMTVYGDRHNNDCNNSDWCMVTDIIMTVYGDRHNNDCNSSDWCMVTDIITTVYGDRHNNDCNSSDWCMVTDIIMTVYGDRHNNDCNSSDWCMVTDIICIFQSAEVQTRR